MMPSQQQQSFSIEQFNSPSNLEQTQPQSQLQGTMPSQLDQSQTNNL